jgi:lysophospholipase L1-like esterase
VAWRRYVALGDSFTEGLDDPYPDGSMYRGWADLVATRLAVDVPGLVYANLAIRGRKLGPVVEEQVPVALGLEPDLVSFAAGGNDVLRRSFDAVAVTTLYVDTVKRLRGDGADVIVFKFAELNERLPGRNLVRARAELLNRTVEETSAATGAYLVDLWGDDAFRDPAMWSVDRLHLNPYGHRRVAAHVLTVLGIEPDPDWWAAPPPAPRRSLTDDARWFGTHFAPWVRRRLTGRSSGDDRAAKRPTLGPPA